MSLTYTNLPFKFLPIMLLIVVYWTTRAFTRWRLTSGFACIAYQKLLDRTTPLPRHSAKFRTTAIRKEILCIFLNKQRRKNRDWTETLHRQTMQRHYAFKNKKFAVFRLKYYYLLPTKRIIGRLRCFCNCFFLLKKQLLNSVLF